MDKKATVKKSEVICCLLTYTIRVERALSAISWATLGSGITPGAAKREEERRIAEWGLNQARMRESSLSFFFECDFQCHGVWDLFDSVLSIMNTK